MKYINEFISDENGVETMEWIAIISVTAGLIVIAVKCGNKLKQKLSGIVGSIWGFYGIERNNYINFDNYFIAYISNFRFVIPESL